MRKSKSETRDKRIRNAHTNTHMQGVFHRRSKREKKQKKKQKKKSSTKKKKKMLGSDANVFDNRVCLCVVTKLLARKGNKKTEVETTKTTYVN